MAILSSESLPASAWSCEQWMTWHKLMKKDFGRVAANDIFLAGWNKQGFFDIEYSFCKYDTDFVDYFDKQGLDMSHGVARIVSGAGEAVVETTESVFGAIKLTAKLLPFAIIFVVGVAGYLIWKTARAAKGEDIVAGSKLAATRGAIK